MALIGSTIYVFVGLLYYYFITPDFIDTYTIHILAEAERSGATEAQLELKTEEMAELKEQIKNPLFAIVITYFEVLPLGLIVALISALILRRK